MASDNRFLDDIARVAGGAASLISTIGRQVGSDFKERAGASRTRSDSGNAREIERLQASVSKYRLEQEQMKLRIAELEAAIGGKQIKKAAAKKPVKTASKKKTGK